MLKEVPPETEVMLCDVTALGMFAFYPVCEHKSGLQTLGPEMEDDVESFKEEDGRKIFLITHHNNGSFEEDEEIGEADVFPLN